MVIGNMGSGCDRFGEGRKKQCSVVKSSYLHMLRV